MPQVFQVAQRPIYQKEELVRSAAYRRFVKSFPCAACRKKWGIDPCHTGPHGVSIKSSDLTCIPLCRKCHRLYDANPDGFAALHRLNIPALVLKQIRLWKQRKAA